MPNETRTAERPSEPVMLDVEPMALAPAGESHRDEAPPRRPQVVAPIAGREPVVGRGAMVHSVEVAELFAAMAEAQGAFKDIERSREAHIRSPRANYDFEYETLADVIRATKDALKANGLAVMQFPDVINNSTLSVRTYVTHRSGQWLYNDMRCAIDGVDPKAVGSGVTYLCRYARKAILGLAAEWDDDAEAATPKGAAPQPAQRRSQQPPQSAQPPASPQQPAAAQQPAPQAAAVAPAPPASVGRVVAVTAVGDGTAWAVTLDTRFRAGTRNAELAKEAERHVGTEQVVELRCTPPSNPRYAPTIDEIALVRS